MTEIHFGTDGWRAQMADTFTVRNVQIAAQAIANYVKRHSQSLPGLIVGYDTRFFSENFAQKVASVLLGNGLPVYLMERATPTPITAYAVKILGATGAVMITASHNPPQYNGIKYIPDYAGPATSEITSAIEQEIKEVVKDQKISTSSLVENKSLSYINPINQYKEHLKQIIDFDILRKAELNIVVDPMYGASQGIIDVILGEAGCNVTAIHNRQNVLFGGSPPDPSLENLAELAAMVTKKRADLGLALDGDADRFGVIDSQGKYLSPNQILPLLCIHLLETRLSVAGGVVVRSASTTHLLDVIASEHGLKTIETPVGFKYIGQLMREKSVIIGGEESGGLSIMGHISEKDGILGCLLVAEMMAAKRRPLSEELAAIYEKYGYTYTERLDIPCTRERMSILLSELRTNPPSFPDNVKIAKIQNLNGIKFLLEDGDWMMARPSGTEPLVRVYIESHSAERFNQLKLFAKQLFYEHSLPEMKNAERK